jgi:phosphatidylglycerophosphatase A
MKRLAASCFGLGRLPVAPGTWGSVPPAVVFVLLCYLGLSGWGASIVMAVLALVGSIVCVKCSPAVIAVTGKTDPGEVVADEFAGQAVTFMIIAAVSADQIWITALLGFVLFRIFDIAKPWPIRRLEKLPQGWGILADDLLAGVYAAIVLLLCAKLGVTDMFAGSAA